MSVFSVFPSEENTTAARLIVTAEGKPFVTFDIDGANVYLSNSASALRLLQTAIEAANLFAQHEAEKKPGEQNAV